ncbi:MAG: class I adenylate-forming enzyme family protein [Myxococcota bacterium]
MKLPTPQDVLGTVRRLVNDPPARRLERFVRVGRQVGLQTEFHPGRVPALLSATVQLGLKTRAIHALHALNTPDRLALVDERRSLTYAEASDEMNRLGNALHSHFGVVGRTPVVLMMENCVEYVVAWFALARLGAAAVHASYRLTPRELEYLVRHSGARVAIVSESAHACAAQLQKDAPDLNLRLIVVSDQPHAGAERYGSLLSGVSNAPPPRDAAVQSENVVYTSGTTGKPKGAVRDFASIGVTELMRVLERLPFRMGERHLVVSPVYHSAGQVFTLLHAALGSTVYLRPHFDPEDTLKALSRWGINSIFLVPTMLRRLVTLAPELFGQNPTPYLRGIVSGAAEFPHSLRMAAIERFGAHAIHDFYGATELGWVTIINGEEMLRKPGSVGRPLAGQQVRILDEQGHEQKPGTVGLIYVRNDQTMAGYLHDEAATSDTRRGEWMTVEDLGYIDEDGYLFLAGRARDMVKSGGVNIYPVEIEEVLARHPAVAEVAVIGIPDPDWGEKLVGVVVPRTKDLDPADLERFGREHLASLKVPKVWHLVAELPRNATGKVLKKELRQRFGPPSAR